MKFCLLHTEQMKKRKPSFQRSHKLEVLRQICNWIPNFLVSRLARETGVADRARTFSPWSHVVAMLYAQLTHAISLNDVCDALRLFSGPLSAIRGAVPPSPNAFSHANKVRDARMAERLLWSVLEHLQNLHPRRSEEHTSELQSPCNLVCRLLLEKKKNRENERSYSKH